MKRILNTMINLVAIITLPIWSPVLIYWALFSDYWSGNYQVRQMVHGYRNIIQDLMD